MSQWVEELMWYKEVKQLDISILTICSLSVTVLFPSFHSHHEGNKLSREDWFGLVLFLIYRMGRRRVDKN